VTRISVITSFVVLSLIVASTASAKAGKEVTFDHHDVPRSYVLFEPETHDDVPPLLLLLHGSGRRGGLADQALEETRRSGRCRAGRAKLGRSDGVVAL
jgi:poly(3-hydroxybutyrate) depolymerase